MARASALEAGKDAGGQIVLWHDRHDPAPDEWSRRAVLTIETPEQAVDVRQFRAVAPFMRERWRGRFSMQVGVEMPEGLGWRQLRTFLALCPAVVASGTTALEAMAFATPLVSDSATAAALGATDGVHLLVVDDDHRRAVEQAIALGADHRQGAAIGRAGRRLVEESHDLSRPADDVARALGWPPAGGRLAGHLRDLPTPPLSRPITRAEARVAELSVR